ncbi:hypothetical protein [Aurantivibrio infirmus]
MTKDCTQEFKLLDRKIGVFWLAYISYLIASVLTFQAVVSPREWGSFKFYIFFAGVVLGLLILLRYLSPRCPSCKQGLYSVVEIKKYPVVVKTWIGKHCWGCGAKLKT